MASDIRPDTVKVSTLYFDADGLGPDHVYLELFPLRADEIMPAALSLRVRAGELVLRAQIDGGYFMQHAQVAELHKALGDWLAKHPAKEGT